MGQITSRERTAILQSLAAGVVPAVGLQHIQVGRLDEVAALLGDLQWVAQGASTVRLVIGRYGSGKTFFLNLIRHVAVRQPISKVGGVTGAHSGKLPFDVADRDRTWNYEIVA